MAFESLFRNTIACTFNAIVSFRIPVYARRPAQNPSKRMKYNRRYICNESRRLTCSTNLLGGLAIVSCSCSCRSCCEVESYASVEAIVFTRTGKIPHISSLMFQISVGRAW